MDIREILTPERTFCRVPASSKKKAIEIASERIAEVTPGLAAERLYARLTAREKVSPTALGEGIAIPHCRLDQCTSILGSLLTLDTPVDYEANDDIPVTTLFVLIVPEAETDRHLQVMAMLMARFQHDTFRSGLRTARSSHDLYHHATSYVAPATTKQQQGR